MNGLTRDHAPEGTVAGGAVAEGRFEVGLTRDPDTGMHVAGIAVSE